jgi:hypothetical protein
MTNQTTNVLILPDLSLFLDIPNSGLALSGLYSTSQTGPKNFTDALESLVRLKNTGLIYCKKIHKNEWTHNYIDVDESVNSSSILSDRTHSYHFYLSENGLNKRKAIEEHLDYLLMSKQELPKTLSVLNQVVLVQNFTPVELPASESAFDSDPDCVAHTIINLIVGWSSVLDRGDSTSFNTSDFSKAYSSYQNLFESLIRDSFKPMDILRALYLIEDVVDITSCLNTWNKVDFNVIETLRSFTETDDGETSWIEGLDFMTLPSPDLPGLSQLLHTMCLRTQEIERDLYKQQTKWHKGPTPRPFTEEELLVSELKILTGQVCSVQKLMYEWASNMDPRLGYSEIEAKYSLIKESPTKEYKIAIESSKAIESLDSIFLFKDFMRALNEVRTSEALYMLDQLESLGYIKTSKTSIVSPTLNEYTKT